MCDEEKIVREAKAYALALGIILFSFPSLVVLADLWGIQDKRPVIYGCTFIFVSMILWTLQKGEIGAPFVEHNQQSKGRPVQSVKWSPSSMMRKESQWGSTRIAT
jgi:hypothetical protein